MDRHVATCKVSQITKCSHVRASQLVNARSRCRGWTQSCIGQARTSTLLVMPLSRRERQDAGTATRQTHCTRYAPGPGLAHCRSAMLGANTAAVRPRNPAVAGRAAADPRGAACAKRLPVPNPQADAVGARAATLRPMAPLSRLVSYTHGPGLPVFSSARSCATLTCCRAEAARCERPMGARGSERRTEDTCGPSAPGVAYFAPGVVRHAGCSPGRPLPNRYLQRGALAELGRKLCIRISSAQGSLQQALMNIWLRERPRRHTGTLAARSLGAGTS